MKIICFAFVFWRIQKIGEENTADKIFNCYFSNPLQTIPRAKFRTFRWLKRIKNFNRKQMLARG